MKIYYEGQDRGGMENECFLLVKYNRQLKREPAVIIKHTFQLCFSFFWDALRMKNVKRGQPINYKRQLKTSSLLKIK